MYRYLLVYGLYLELIIIVASNLFINWKALRVLSHVSYVQKFISNFTNHSKIDGD